MNRKIIKIQDIILDEDIYPRNKYDWFVANSYKNSLLAGANFPPIEVAILDGKLLLIDGKHRIEANKALKNKHIQAIIYKDLDKREIFRKAVESNINHGKPLSVQDKALVVDKLEKLNFSVEEISKLVGVPLEKMEAFKFRKITNTISGKTIFLKSTVSNFAGQEVSENFNEFQYRFNSYGQIRLLQQIISLYENNLADYKNIKVMEATQKLKSILNSIRMPKLKK